MGLFFSLIGWATTDFRLMQLTTADGLTNNTVRIIIQDKRGRLWIGTSNGLSCFDGKSFKNFRPHPNRKSLGLADQRVMDMRIDTNNRLWVFSPTGAASCMDLTSDKFINYNNLGISVPNDTSRVSNTEITDRKGRAWHVTDGDGLYITDPQTGISEHFTTHSVHNALPTDALKCIFMDDEGVIWIGTNNLGLTRIELIKNEGVDYCLEGINIRMLCRLNDNRLAVGDRQGNIWIYNSTLSQELAHFSHFANTYCAMLDQDGNLWQGTKGEGLFIGNKHLIPSDSVPYSLAHQDIYELFTDRSGRIWVGTFGGGLCLTQFETESFRTFFNHNYGQRRIRRLVEDPKGYLWAATSHGVYRFLPGCLIADSTNYINLCVENGYLWSDEVRTLYCASDGRVYVAETGEGFAVYESSETIIPQLVCRLNETTDSLVNSMVQCFVEDSDGMIWVSTEFGLSKFNPHSHRLTNYFFSTKMLNNVYSENCGVELSDGRIAFGTNNGLVIINPHIYNIGELPSAIRREEVTIGGQSSRRDIIYIVQRWWKNPWAITIYVVILLFVVGYWLYTRSNNRRFHHTIKELKTQKDDIHDRLTTDIRLRNQVSLEVADRQFAANADRIAATHLSDPQFSVDDFAAEMRLGRTVFFQQMKTITGYSPKEYMNLKRLKRAADLISTTQYTIAEISDIVGVNDPLYFSRIFKQHYGCSPTQWRKKFARPMITPEEASENRKRRKEKENET